MTARIESAIRKLKRNWRTRIRTRSAPAVHRQQIAEDWSEHRYYEDAEQEGWIKTFWGPDSVFRKCFERLDLQNVVEIGCGRGRHAAQCLDRISQITLVDINETNLAACRQRFRERSNVAYVQTEGGTLAGVKDESATAVFSYDAMVHFEATDVISYIIETHRVLRSGGRALLHYSNYDQNPNGFYRDNPGHRNFFSERMMRHFADRAGFKILEHRIFCWSGNEVLSDGMILLQR